MGVMPGCPAALAGTYPFGATLFHLGSSSSDRRAAMLYTFGLGGGGCGAPGIPDLSAVGGGGGGGVGALGYPD